MITFKTFLQESQRSVEMDFEEAVKFARENCMNAINSTALYRGNRRLNSAKCALIDPIGTERLSANTANYYNLMLSNIHSWKEYPPRNQSVICTTNLSYANKFGRAFRVLPLDGAKLGICPAEDLWDSFKYIEDAFATRIDGNDLNTIIHSIIEAFLPNAQSNAKYDSSVQELKSALHGVDVALSHMKDLELSIKADSAAKKLPTTVLRNLFLQFVQNIKDVGSSWIFFNHILDPEANDFRVENIDDKPRIHSSVEVWTDSKCLLISEDKEPLFLSRVLHDEDIF